MCVRLHLGSGSAPKCHGSPTLNSSTQLRCHTYILLGHRSTKYCWCAQESFRRSDPCNWANFWMANRTILTSVWVSTPLSPQHCRILQFLWRTDEFGVKSLSLVCEDLFDPHTSRAKVRLDSQLLYRADLLLIRVGRFFSVYSTWIWYLKGPQAWKFQLQVSYTLKAYLGGRVMTTYELKIFFGDLLMFFWRKSN